MRRLGIITILVLTGLPDWGYAQSITGTVHNLQAGTSNTIKAFTEDQICIFCHTPHGSRPVAPLWNKNDPGGSYTLYNSSTLDGTPGQPDGSAILCLSCHDGTIALGDVVSRATDIVMDNSITTMPVGDTNLETDLSNDHPVSYNYTSGIASADGQLNDPGSIGPLVQLEGGKIQCTSCHDPHLNIYTKFLVETNENSALCMSCHNRTGWVGSSHEISNATWNLSGSDPWAHIDNPYATVQQNACESCHDQHNALGNLRLMKYDLEENSCLDCHNSNVATEDIQTEINKAYNHNVSGYFLLHDPVEPATVSVKHVECQDCHNPHATRNFSASAPVANGFIEGIKGVDTNGNSVEPIQNEYELCYRCHADSPDKPGSVTSRQIEQNNVRLEFDISNPSFHPVEDKGANTSDVPSLIAPLSETSIIYCTDCHASDGTSSPAGPHGSIYPQILKDKYSKVSTPNMTHVPSNYQLCYNCHDVNVIRSNVVFNKHDFHLDNTDASTSCNTCHDPHGISSSQGNSTNNSHLINFDINLVTPSGSGILYFEKNPGGGNRGQCYLTCHGKDHDPLVYNNN